MNSSCGSCGVVLRPGDGAIIVQGVRYCNDECADADEVRLQSLGSKPHLVVWGADEAETQKWAKALDDLMGGAA